MEAILKSIKKKTSKQDPIPTDFINLCLKNLIPIFTHITNTVFETNHFPNSLKHAYITPVIKDNSKNIDDVSNYRPVSSLPFMMKVIEKGIFDQIDKHITENGLHASHQSVSHKRFNSCETATITILVIFKK
jgi:hypothetical protein